MQTIRSLLTYPDTAAEREIAGFDTAPVNMEELYLRSLAKYRGEAAPPKKRAGITARPGFRAVTAVACLLLTLGIVGGVWAKHQRITPVSPEEPGATYTEPDTTEDHTAASAAETGSAPVVVIPETEPAAMPEATDPTEPQQTEAGVSPTGAQDPTQPINIRTTEPQAGEKDKATDPVTALPTDPTESHTIPATEPEPTEEPFDASSDLPSGDPGEPGDEIAGFRHGKIDTGDWSLIHLVWLGEIQPSPEGYIRYASSLEDATMEVVGKQYFSTEGEEAVYAVQYAGSSFKLWQHRRTTYEAYLKTSNYEIIGEGNCPNTIIVNSVDEYLVWDDGCYTFTMQSTGIGRMEKMLEFKASLYQDPDGERIEFK